MKDEDIIELILKLGMRFSIPDVQYSLLDGEVIATQQQIEAFARAIADLQKENDGDMLDEAMQSDLEHGVRWLNEKASKEFHERYPALSAAIGRINSPETDLDEALRRR